MPKNIAERSAALQADKTLKNLFYLSVESEEAIAQLYNFDGEDVVKSYGDIKQEAYAYGKFLKARFGEGGGFIGIQVDTCPQWFALFWGSIMAGFDTLLLDAQQEEKVIRDMLKEAGAKGIISRKNYAGVETVLVSEIETARDSEGFTPNFASKVALCTSGTTGESRIFVYDEEAVCMQVLNSMLLKSKSKRIIREKAHRTLAFLPLHHVFGFMVNLLWCHFLRYETVYMKNRTPESIFDNCRKYGVTLLVAVPLLINNVCLGVNKKVKNKGKRAFALFSFLKWLSLFLQFISPDFGMYLAKNKLFTKATDNLFGRKLSVIILGGSHTPNEHLRTITAMGYFTVVGFGMTETAVTSVETTEFLPPRLRGAAGRPLVSAEYKVVGKKEGAHTGEMYIRGESLHRYRLLDGKLIAPERTEDGWFKTGDMVKLTRFGRMYVKGRSKDVIINQSGENVYPDELEDFFSKIPFGDQMCILGLRAQTAKKLRFFRKKRLSYEDIALVVNLGSRIDDESYITEMLSEIIRINKRLPVLKQLTRVLVVGTPFETANGIKVKRLKLKQQIENREIKYRELDLASGVTKERFSESAHIEAQKDNLKEKARILFAEALNISPDKVKDDSHFILDLGGDSLMVMGLSLKAEELFGVSFDAEEIGNCVSVNGLCETVRRKLNGEDNAPTQLVEKEPISDFKQSREFLAFAKRHESLMASGLKNPYFVKHDSPLFDVSMMDGRETLNFGSYNYVGMSGNEETKKAAKAAIDQLGTSASGSRLLAGEKSLYQELEKEIAEWKHAESALVLVSGHATNVTCVGNFCQKGDLILYDALAHNSIVEGTKLSRADSKPFPHNDYEALDKMLSRLRKYYEKVLIVIEGAYSMDGDVAPVPEFVKVKKKHGCFLMVDEAHSACVIGKTGGGVDEYFSLSANDIDIRMGTLSKGLGTCGGYLCGRSEIIEYMRYNLPGFVFSVGISPPLAAAALCAIRQLRQNPQILERLHENIAYFVNYAKEKGFDTCLAGETAIIPIMVGSDEHAFLLSNLMQENGVFVPPAVYPAVPLGKARLRFCVISEHKKEQIKQAIDTLETVCAQIGLDIRQKETADKAEKSA